MRRFIGMDPRAVEIRNLGGAGTGTLDKKPPSSRRPGPPISTRLAPLLALILAVMANSAWAAINLSPAETRRIGNRIWQNECGGTGAGLHSWETAENFDSIGIVQ